MAVRKRRSEFSSQQHWFDREAERISRQMLRPLMNKSTGLARGERRRLAEVYNRIRRREPGVIAEVWAWFSGKLNVVHTLRMARGTATASNSATACTSPS